MLLYTTMWFYAQINTAHYTGHLWFIACLSNLGHGLQISHTLKVLIICICCITLLMYIVHVK